MPSVPFVATSAERVVLETRSIVARVVHEAMEASVLRLADLAPLISTNSINLTLPTSTTLPSPLGPSSPSSAAGPLSLPPHSAPPSSPALVSGLSAFRVEAAAWLLRLRAVTAWREEADAVARRAVLRASLKRACGNVGVRTEVRRRLFVGPSTIPEAGLGLFAGEAIDRGDLVQEYRGEIISQLEAERRGAISDTHDRTYLFDLDDEFSIDAMRKGNKIRFANHKPDRQKPNCESRKIVVDGAHRIAVFATRAIAAGEELFYNYDKDIARKRDVIKKRKQPPI
jgi:SET domain